ncbi:MAG TPA: serine/threonine-protein kinase [Polyangia bacterium]
MAKESNAARASTSVRGKRLGRYRLLEHLAGGGMAEIYLARREDETAGFSKELVLKVLQDRFADNPQVVAMFMEEARLSAELRHPNVVDVHDVGVDDGVRFIAMEYIEGRTLTDVITRSFEVARPLSRTLATYVVAEVATGLAYLQEGIPGRGRPPGTVGIVHRDISPTNVVIGWAGQVKIIDFGIAQRGEGGKAQDGTRPGKVSYMSPEQIKGEPVDGRSDIFSLGTILYEITLGQRLWRGPAETVMQRIVDETPAPPTYIQRDYPPALERIVMRALEKRPQDRQATGRQLADELDRFLRDQGPIPGPRTLGEFVRAIYSSDAKVSEGGARLAQVFQDDDAAVDPELAPLDFDRAARAGRGAALAHALRGAEPFELAEEVTNHAAVLPELQQEISGAAPGGATAQGLRGVLAVDSTPAVSASYRSGQADGSALNSETAHQSGIAPPGTGSATARFLILGLLLAILLGGFFYLWKGS